MKRTERAERTVSVAAALRRERVRLALFSLGGFLSAFLPLATLLLLRWERYTAVPAGGVRLTLGGLVIALLLLLGVLGKLKLPSRPTVLAVALALSYLLEAVLAELSLILWVALFGEALDAFLFTPLIRRSRARIERLATANATADAVGELLKMHTGGVRDE